MRLSELKNEDYRSLLWHFVLLAGCVALVGAAFFLAGELKMEASRQLTIASSERNNAQAALDQIEQEEAAITENIEAYRRLAAGQIVGPADRLEMQEHFAQIRSRFSLFPIRLEIDQESSYTLPYDPGIAQPGGPVNLMINKLDTALPLLHENDLANYLDALLATPALLVPIRCSITTNTRDNSAYLRLGQHQQSTCSFQWYNFNVATEGRISP